MLAAVLSVLFGLSAFARELESRAGHALHVPYTHAREQAVCIRDSAYSESAFVSLRLQAWAAALVCSLYNSSRPGGCACSPRQVYAALAVIGVYLPKGAGFLQFFMDWSVFTRVRAIERMHAPDPRRSG